MRAFFFIFVLVSSFLFTSCEQLAVWQTAKKQPRASKSALAAQAEQQFWQTLHTGNYAAIPVTDALLTRAYLENPNDPTLASHLGFLHIWKIAEHERSPTKDPLIVNEIILAQKYFADALTLNPHDARILGFLGDSLLISGQIFHDKREQVRGYFVLKRAIRAWPEFNYFTAGYAMSVLPPTDPRFKEALNWQWATLDLCAGTHIDRITADFSPYLTHETQKGPNRACWNSWIAPHNFEGFFLNMGDMLVKSGDWQSAKRIYANAKLSKTYQSWPYRSLLEARIEEAQTNVRRFNEAQPLGKPILFNSGYGCVVCHQTK